MAEVKKENWFKRTWGKVCKYFRELRSELKKVVWPTPQQVLKNTLVVVGCVIVVGIFIWLFDFVAQVGINAELSDEVEQPDKDTDTNHAANNDCSILQHLLGGGPDDLLQFAAQLTEVSLGVAPGSFEPVFLFDFSHD